MIPNLITINRTEETSEDSSSERNSFSNLGLEIISKDLEGYRDAVLGTIVFNRTTVPRTRCEEFRSVVARQDIITSQALLRANLEVIRDRKGRTLIPHVQGEAVMLYRCKPTMVKVRHNVRQCCQELPIWHGKNFSTPAFLQPISKKISSVCTPRVCNKFDTPIFNIGSTKLSKWIRIEKDGEIKQTENPQEFIPQSHNNRVAYSDQKSLLPFSNLVTHKSKE